MLCVLVDIIRIIIKSFYHGEVQKMLKIGYKILLLTSFNIPNAKVVRFIKASILITILFMILLLNISTRL